MADFKKTEAMTNEQIKEILNTDFGARLKVKDIKVNHHIIMKILAVPKSEIIGEGKDAFTVHTIKCEYDNTKNGGKKFPLDVQVGQNAITRLTDKYPEGDYIGKRAFFTKTSYEGKNPQFVNPIMGEFNEPVNKDDLFAPVIDNTVKDPEEKPKEEPIKKEDDLLFNSDEMEEKVMSFIAKPEELELLEKIKGLDQSVITEDKFHSTVMGRLNTTKGRSTELWKIYGNQ